MKKLKVELSYSWEPILIEGKKEYFFPNKITAFMREHYKQPAVYRWDIYRDTPEDEKLIYIGKAEILCPRRIYGYLNPGPSQQTNKRMKKMFLEYIDKGFKVGLEILEFDKITFGEFNFYPEDLKDKHLRKALEEMMIIYYKEKGFTILNL